MLQKQQQEVDSEASWAAYVRSGRLCMIGVADTPDGPIPVACHIRIEGDAPDGPIPEKPTDNVQQAVNKAQEEIVSRIEFERMRVQAEEAVLRARAGDQNAMALLQCVGEDARAGNDRAQLAYGLIQEYIRAHPFGGEFGQDTKVVRRAPPKVRTLGLLTQCGGDELRYPAAIASCLPNVLGTEAVIALANGPPLLRTRIEHIAQCFGEAANAFRIGVRHCTSPDILRTIPPSFRKVVQAGRCVGMARKIQGVRFDSVPLSTLSPTIAWELGE